MKVDLKTAQLITVAALFILLYSGRLIKGSPKQTPEGLAFPLKPIVVWGRALLFPLYIIFFILPVWQTTHHLPVWLPLIVLALAVLLLWQMPGTILLGATGITQRFWLHKDKEITYPQVMSVQKIGAGRMTRVLGNNNVTITHTWNHSGAAEFAAEVERKTGKRAIQ
jgi:hypothetical protein